MKNKLKIPQHVQLPEKVIVKAQAQAQALGLSLADYVQLLIDRDIRTKEDDPWLQPIPKEVDEKWEEDIAAFDEQEKTKPRPSAKTVSEFRTLLEQEAKLLPDEGN